MKIYVFPADAGGCGHYRLNWPAAAINEQDLGVEVRVINLPEGTGIPGRVTTLEDGTEIITKMMVPPDADLVVLQRPGSKWHPQMINLLTSNGIPVVVDLDDDVLALKDSHIAYKAYDPAQQAKYSWQYMDLSCRLATFVTVSTPALLKKYAMPGRGVALDNYVPQRYLDVVPNPVWDDDNPTFGWAGSVPSHPGDLNVTGDAVARLVRNDRKRLYVIGDGINIDRAFGLRLTDPRTVTGLVPLYYWPQAIADHLTVGIAPLEDNKFNKSKSRLKPMEYMSVGVPWVASPRVEYTTLRKKSGVGFLADTPRDWHRHVKTLLESPSLRQDQREAGKEYMSTQTYEKNAWRWVEAWQRAVDIYHGKTQ